MKKETIEGIAAVTTIVGFITGILGACVLSALNPEPSEPTTSEVNKKEEPKPVAFARPRPVRYVYCDSHFTYADAVAAINKSDMISSRKSEAEQLIPFGADSELYEAIISIINDTDSLSSMRIDRIKNTVSKWRMY